MALTTLDTAVTSTPLNGVLNFDVVTQTILYASSPATGNYQINFRGDSVTSFAAAVPVGQTVLTKLFVANGATPFSLTAITVDGVAPTILGLLNNLPILNLQNEITQLPIAVSHTAPGVFYVY